MKVNGNKYGAAAELKGGETEHRQENPLTSGIIRRKSIVTQPGIEPGSPWWKASRLAAHSPRLARKQVANPMLPGVKYHWLHSGATANEQTYCWLVVRGGESLIDATRATTRRNQPAPCVVRMPCDGGGVGPGVDRQEEQSVFAVECWLEHSSPTEANLVRFPVGSLPNFRNWKLCRTMPLVPGFTRGSPVSLPFLHSGADPCLPHFALTRSRWIVLDREDTSVMLRGALTHAATLGKQRRLLCDNRRGSPRRMEDHVCLTDTTQLRRTILTKYPRRMSTRALSLHKKKTPDYVELFQARKQWRDDGETDPRGYRLDTCIYTRRVVACPRICLQSSGAVLVAAPGDVRGKHFLGHRLGEYTEAKEYLAAHTSDMPEYV
ncbi:hypothetical protein PR048_003892 [Dryococelus australis]|uniref:Uncharacterized protein n=1 Tax=Dryococelus australis TaxID=614101 RepID=A0ABQ9IPH6_9NEOP|nr:hypothetical protein PR048_003892 [Dryococelus australis]